MANRYEIAALLISSAIMGALVLFVIMVDLLPFMSDQYIHWLMGAVHNIFFGGAR